MSEKENLTKELKKVIITGKTYTEYIDAIADHLLNNYDIAPKGKYNYGKAVEYRGKQSKPNDNRCVACGEIIPEGLQVCHSCALRGYGHNR